jgi:hypothetical protein
VHSFYGIVCLQDKRFLPLCIKHAVALIFKFAGLAVPARMRRSRCHASNSHTISNEIKNVKEWATVNNLKLNTGKSQEMIVVAPTNKTKITLPTAESNITRVDKMTILGVTITDSLKMTYHIAEKIQTGCKSLFALKTLKAHGMPQAELQTVFRATALSSILYAAPAWWGLTTAEDKLRLEAFLRKCSKYGYYDTAGPTIGQLVDSLDATLFENIQQKQNHVLKSLLPAKKIQTHDLRPRAHSLTLPAKTTSLRDKQFMTRMLYEDCY